jgi:predicted ATPase
VLIILDNCEHLVDAIGRIAQRILEHTHEVKILATSRIALNRPGEQRIAILGLQQTYDEHTIGEAAELFIDRAKALQSSLDVGSRTIAAIQSICERVDGLPLAIELAASRTDVLSVNEIAEFLRDSPALLEAEHASRDIHRSLEAAITWSVSLLDEDQRARFRALGAFDGPFTAEAAASILRSRNSLNAVRELKPLVDASLVVARPAEAGATVYRLLEPLRQHARHSLEETGDWTALTERHDLYYVGVSRSRRGEMFGSGRVAAVRRIELELADYMAAWDRLMEQDPTAVLSLAWSLGHHWLSAHVGSGFARLAGLLEAVGDDASVECADALTIASWVAMYANEWERGIAWADRAISIYEEADDQLGLAYAHARKGHWAFGRGDAAGAMESLPLSLEICDRIGNEEGKAWPTVLIGQARRWSDDEGDDVFEMLVTAKGLFASTDDSDGQVHAGMVLATFFDRDAADRLRIAEEMVDLAERRGADSALRPTALHALSHVTWELDERERAEGLNRACIRAAFTSGNLIVLGLGLMQAARYAGLRGLAKRCAMLSGAGRAHFAFELAPFQLRVEADAVSAAKTLLGETEYDELLNEGASMTAEEAAALALR